MLALKDTLNEAGISQVEFALMMKVSRTTMYKWAAGTSNPANFIAPRVRKALALVRKATQMGLLPADTALPNKDNREERMMAIQTALKTATETAPADA